MSWPANLPLFAGLRTVRACLLELSALGYSVTRVRIVPDGARIEIDTPLQCVDAVAERGDYQQARFRDCDVVWRKPENET